eukprot:TRINITY_DN48852_c0_g1_i1.p1 TRINITY_DN48852_c0_g1~~TRINITY_DN48852_c0_g1_i1.p1  ORF type:complete len:247 (+),score=40.71 TRINITY_DN48852_c0_g1_i1:51-791(+)
MFKDMKMLLCFLFLGSFQLTASYKYMADCVPGSIVGSLNQTGGRIGAYTVALQILLPFYKDLKVLAAGPGADCLAAANAVNTNLVLSREGGIKEVLHMFPEMHEVGIFGVMKKASALKSYLYVFDLKSWTPYQYIGDCVPGVAVKELNQTKGLVGPYAEALQSTRHQIYGDVELRAVTRNLADCKDVVDRINAGNSSLVEMVRRKKIQEVRPILPSEAATMEAHLNLTYLYAFENKMWNKTSNWWI